MKQTNTHIPGIVEWEHTNALEIVVRGEKHFIGRKGSSFRSGKLEELAKAELAGRPCRDYDSDCEDMTLKQIDACHRSPGDNDDHCGYCVMKRRCN